ncbi:DNA cytosine methyltransferase [Sphingomonas beigongshangi]|uniref:DNA cytosine methyltransferase n=1 Tax=Sphingomonas beigongshangi TaxID=2782540 RepID=UPI00193B0D76|nr:DNA (cytosine-5-)-methyltransferase [Sphingomonas beigongshangi]
MKALPSDRMVYNVRAIDLYSGIGGWSLGLKLAGVQVVNSYEWWKPAIDTHNANFGGELEPVDIRKLELADLPDDIELVVGSPPCTEFSYSNRGGSGNISEGLKDLVKFFEVVDHLKPKFWAMENVPRVEQVIRKGMADPKHVLYSFRHLAPEIDVFDFSEYGAPQARRRCIATNIPLDIIKGFGAHVEPRTLGDVVQSLSAGAEVVDPVWGVRLPIGDVTETQSEPPLRGEELRMNRDAKEHHPVYNNMAFPDPLDRAARTVTATCTRVSRESIVIADPRRAGEFRRLTIRERAGLQGFPITYQFFGRSFAEKAKMIGNAIPPTFTHLIALAAQGVKPEQFLGFAAAGNALQVPKRVAPVTEPDGEGRTYPAKRAFRAALPGFRFKSGMRFDLSNTVLDGGTQWSVRFFYGPSKDIRQIDLDGEVTRDLRRSPWLAELLTGFRRELARAESFLVATSPNGLQEAWTKRSAGIGPFEVTDKLAALAEELHSRIEAELDPSDGPLLADYIVTVASGGGPVDKLVSRGKLERNAARIIAGIVVGEWFNGLTWHCEHKAAA